jgi:hypothetical protein
MVPRFVKSEERCPLCGERCWLALYRERGGSFVWTYLETFAGADALAEALAEAPERTLHRVGEVAGGVSVVEDAPDGKFLRHDCFRAVELPLD